MEPPRIFTTRVFQRWRRKADISDAALVQAVTEMQAGLIDADLGGGILKKRVALPGRGKRGSARTLVATKRGTRWFFVFGFAKNARDNITDRELKALQTLAADLFQLADDALARAISQGVLQEIAYANETSRQPDPANGA